jgi:secreted Zn-dependent insulinase-like peptidase
MSEAPCCFQSPIRQAVRLAQKFANAPKVISVITLGNGLTTLLITQPMVTPATAGQPKTMDKGIKASATLT